METGPCMLYWGDWSSSSGDKEPLHGFKQEKNMIALEF